jgi:hypothetical protein
MIGVFHLGAQARARLLEILSDLSVRQACLAAGFRSSMKSRGSRCSIAIARSTASSRSLIDEGASARRRPPGAETECR